MAAAKATDDATAKSNRSAVRALMLCNLCRNFGTRIRMGTELEIWMNQYGADLAGMAMARGNLESMAGVLSFLVGPPLAALSDSIGRRPLMIISPMFSVVVAALVAWSPSVGMLYLRRMTMAFSQASQHGESAALADLFAHDAAAYGMAKARINVVGDIADIVCPVVGASLATRSLGLPWAISSVCMAVMVVVSYLFLHETLPESKRVPFRPKHANPLGFLKLFRSGPKLRLVAIAKMWSRAFCGRWSTYRYEEMHQQQLLQWDLQQRGNYASYRGLLNMPASFISGWLLRVVGVHFSLLLGHASVMAEHLAAAVSSRGWHFYAIRPLRLSSDVAELALEFTATSAGAECGVPQGELQGSLKNLETIVRIVSPMLWGRIYTLGVRLGRPSLFFYVAAAAGLVQLALVSRLKRMPKGEIPAAAVKQKTI